MNRWGTLVFNQIKMSKRATPSDVIQRNTVRKHKSMHESPDRKRGNLAELFPNHHRAQLPIWREKQVGAGKKNAVKYATSHTEYWQSVEKYDMGKKNIWGTRSFWSCPNASSSRINKEKGHCTEITNTNAYQRLFPYVCWSLSLYWKMKAGNYEVVEV